jgi:hypothetical protein
MFKREILDIPQNLLVLLRKLDELDRIPVVLAPSIVPSIEETVFADATSHSPPRLVGAK